MKRRAWIAALASAVALALAASAGATRTVPIPSTVSIEATGGLRFDGRVTSPNHACEAGRRVVLLRVVAGGPDQALGHDVTDSRGRWSVRVQGFAGVSLSRFYAKAKPRSEGTAGTIYVCGGDRSRTVGLGT